MPYNDFEDEDKTPVLMLRHCRHCDGAGVLVDGDVLITLCVICEGRGLIPASKDTYSAR